MKLPRILLTYNQIERDKGPTQDGWLFYTTAEETIEAMVKRNVDLWEQYGGTYTYDIFINGWCTSIGYHSAFEVVDLDKMDQAGDVPEKHHILGDYIRKAIDNRTQHQIGKLVL
jgi:hypothetical protein